MKFTILLDILFELLSKRKLTAGYLAEKHEISVRTVYRYVDELTFAVPVFVQRGRNGGIFISDNYKLPVGFMKKEEYEAAIEALELAYAQLPEDKFLQAKEKLSDQAKKELRSLTLAGTPGTLIVDGGTWGDTVNFSEKLRLFQECVKDCHVVEIDYTDRVGESSRRKIEPHVLIFKQGVWYVYAFCRKQRAFRLFRLGRVRSTFVTEAKFIRRNFRREDIPLNYFANTSSSVEVRLEINDGAYADAQDWLGGENLVERNGRWFADVTLPDDDVLVRKLLGFGNAVTVLAPNALREKLKKAAAETAALY